MYGGVRVDERGKRLPGALEVLQHVRIYTAVRLQPRKQVSAPPESILGALEIAQGFGDSTGIIEELRVGRGRHGLSTLPNCHSFR